MDNKDIQINRMIMEEIGLDVGEYNRIIDQDTGLEISMKGQYIVAPGSYCGHNAIEFDPYNNRKMMNQFFSYFIKKVSLESENEVLTYYNINGDDNTKGQIECRLSDNQIIRSGAYSKDSLRYADLIMRLNGRDDVDLSEYDMSINKPIAGVKRKKNATTKNKTNS